jgi:hypothetical protein
MSDGWGRLKELRALEQNWDSYGAPALDLECIDKAWHLYCCLPGTEWSFVPCSDGGVQLEQHAGGFDIEVTISPASRRD